MTNSAVDATSEALVSLTERYTSFGATVVEAATSGTSDADVISWARAAAPTLRRIERDLEALERRLRRHIPKPEGSA